MKYNSIPIKATIFEAFLSGGKITLIQGNTYENAILHHINDRSEFAPSSIEKELFPFLPPLIGEKLLQGFVREGKLIEWNGRFDTPQNWSPENSVLEMPENSIVKVKVLEIGKYKTVLEASLENQRRPGRESKITPLNGYYSATLNGRSGFSVNFEGCSCFDRRETKHDKITLEFNKKATTLCIGSKAAIEFNVSDLIDFLPKGVNLEEQTIPSEVRNPVDAGFLETYTVNTLRIDEVDFTLKEPINFTKVPDSPASGVNAMYLMVAGKFPQDAESYKLVVSDIWNTLGTTWGFTKEELFPNGFPSYQSFREFVLKSHYETS